MLKHVYQQAVNDCNKCCINWVHIVKKLLNDYDFPDVYDNVNIINAKTFPLVFKNKLIDLYKRDWYNKVNHSTMFDLYKFFKPEFGYELYLDVLPKSLRLFFCRLRLSVHPLMIQTGRYNTLPRNERRCLICNTNDIEDEFHFICICPCYNDIRKQYIPRNIFVKPSVYKYTEMLKTIDKNELIKISLFIKHALRIRSNTNYSER